MKKIDYIKNIFIIYFFALLAIQCNNKSVSSIPHLEKRGLATQLIVDGKPFLALGGELLNSSSSGLRYMDTIWPKLAKMNLNTVLGGVSWDLIEPAEGKFDFTTITQQYARSNNPMFIPESFAGTEGASNAFYIIGQLKSMGYSPFGIETREQNPGKGPMSNAYKVLGQLAPVILDAQSRGTIAGVSLNKQDSVKNIHLGNYDLKVELRVDRRGNNKAETGYGILINTGFDEYIIAGADIEVSFFTTAPQNPTVGLASVFEGTFENGNWIPGRKLNGDEIMKNYDFAGEALKNSTGTVARIKGPNPAILKVKLYKY